MRTRVFFCSAELESGGSYTCPALAGVIPISFDNADGTAAWNVHDSAAVAWLGHLNPPHA